MACRVVLMRARAVMCMHVLVSVLSMCDVSACDVRVVVPCLWHVRLHVRPSVVVVWSWSVRLSLWSVVSRAVSLSWHVASWHVGMSLSYGFM